MNLNSDNIYVVLYLRLYLKMFYLCSPRIKIHEFAFSLVYKTLFKIVSFIFIALACIKCF